MTVEHLYRLHRHRKGAVGGMQVCLEGGWPTRDGSAAAPRSRRGAAVGAAQLDSAADERRRLEAFTGAQQVKLGRGVESKVLVTARLAEIGPVAQEVDGAAVKRVGCHHQACGALSWT